MRGKALRASLYSFRARITPAYAGKRNSTGVPITSSGDHPRLCGEKGIWNELADTAVGSPPPMRGKVFVHTEFIIEGRITPAYAGKSQLWILRF